jgi:hypothetical protein
VLEALGKPTWNAVSPSHENIFRICNNGERAARWVKPQSVKSNQGTYVLHFEEIAALSPGQFTTISYSVNNSVALDQGMLWSFFHDNEVRDDPGEGAALVWWDIKIRFRDTDESVKEEIVRLCYDLETDNIYTTAVPYTEHDFKRHSRVS